MTRRTAMPSRACHTLALFLGLSAATGCLTDSALIALSGPSQQDTGTETATEGDSSESASITLTAVTSDTDAGHGSSGSTTDDSFTSGDGSSTTEGALDEPPQILDVSLWPKTITRNGLITANVTAQGSEGVRMSLDNGDVIDLVEVEPGVFVGESPIITGLDNGLHAAKFIPWRENPEEVDPIEGAAKSTSYTVALPQPGTELLWETGDDLYIGQGWVVAMGSRQTGEVIELGTRIGADDKRRCFMRQRGEDGGWSSSDIVALFPADECEAVDLVVREDGTIHTLLSRKLGDNSWQWVLSEFPVWGSQPQEMATGTVGEEAKALAYRGDTLVICGDAPSGFGDRSAFLRIFEPGEPIKARTFDYGSDEQVHEFDEYPADCIVSDENQVVMIGSVLGGHDGLEQTARRFLLPIDLTAEDDSVIKVGAPGLVSQSFAAAVDVGQGGEIYVAGYICDAPCEGAVEGRLWVYDEAGIEQSGSGLGLFSYPILAPHSLRWHAGGYVLIAHGGFAGDDDSFMLRAFAPDAYSEALWTYSRKDALVTHIPLTAFIGRYGQLYLGGLGASLYPSVLYAAS